MMRDKLKLEDLPDAVHNGVLASRSVAQDQLNVIEEGKWFCLDGKPLEMKVDIFYYRGRYWKHTKSRNKGGHQWPVILDDPELIQVFPRTKAVTVYE